MTVIVIGFLLVLGFYYRSCGILQYQGDSEAQVNTGMIPIYSFVTLA